MPVLILPRHPNALLDAPQLLLVLKLQITQLLQLRPLQLSSVQPVLPRNLRHRVIRRRHGRLLTLQVPLQPLQPHRVRRHLSNLLLNRGNIGQQFAVLGGNLLVQVFLDLLALLGGIVVLLADFGQMLL